MQRPVHFDLYADDTARAVKFYTDVFGWKFEKWDNPVTEYWLIMTGPDGTPGINGGLGPRNPEYPAGVSHAATLTYGVPDYAEYAEKVRQAGGEAGEKMPIPGFGWHGMCKDTEGNVFGIMQDDKEAR
jgi:uncharacterized protein